MNEEYGRNHNAGNNYSGRKQAVHKYGDNKGKNYSPSASYNYQNSQGRGQGQGYQQHPRRRIDRYKRENINFSDKLVKQNDIIIKLLKEIRDNLVGTASPVGEVETAEVNEQEKTSIPVEDSQKEPAETSISAEDEKKPEADASDSETAEDSESQPVASEDEEKTPEAVD